MFVQAITFEMAELNFGLKKSYLKKVVEVYGVKTNYPKGYTDSVKLNAAVQLKEAKQLYKEYGVTWKKYFPVDPKFPKDQQTVLTLLPEHFEKDDYRTIGLFITPAAKQELNELGVSNKVYTPTPSNDKKNKEMGIVPKDIFEHGIINVYCRDCRKEQTPKWLSKNKCTHPIDRKYYLTTLSTTERKRSALKARFPLEAANEATEFYFQYINRSFNEYTKTEEAVQEKRKETIQYLSEGIEAFLAYKTPDEKNPLKANSKVTDGHLKEMQRAYNKLLQILSTTKHRNLDLKYFQDADETDPTVNEVVTLIYSALQSERYTEPSKAQIKAAREKGVHLQRIGGKKDGDLLYSPKTINKYSVHFSSLFIYINKRFKMNLYNPFSTISFAVENDPKAVSPKQFQQIIDFIDTNPNVQGKHKKVCNHDLPWLKKAYILEKALVARRKDIVNMKWSDIIFDEENQVFVLRVGNNKASTLRKKQKKATVSYEPITPELMNHFIQWGYKDKLDSTDYILQGIEDQAKLAKGQSRRLLEDKMSGAFTVLGKMLFGEKFDLEHASLRKNKLTGNAHKYGDRAHELSHKSKATFLNHYVDQYQLGVLKAAEQQVA